MNYHLPAWAYWRQCRAYCGVIIFSYKFPETLSTSLVRASVGRTRQGILRPRDAIKQNVGKWHGACYMYLDALLLYLLPKDMVPRDVKVQNVGEGSFTNLKHW